MAASNNTAGTADEFGRSRILAGLYPDNSPLNVSALSWSSIIAGAGAAAALSLILLMLGVGLGLSSISPWVNSGVTAATLGVSTILWLTLTQLLASGMGGYLAGRLRTRWIEVHTDEVYFRDTAHGFLAWAVASLTTAALLSSAIGSIISGGAQAGATVAGSVASTAMAATASGAVAAGSEMSKAGTNEPINYFIDSLFRKDISTAISSPAGSSAVATGSVEQTASSAGNSAPEVTRIFMNTIRNGTLPAEDLRYVGQLVAQRTGMTQQEAEKRVRETYARLQATLHNAEISAKDAADKARKASAYAALWLFISLLIGAFVASLAATYGGRRRDA
jgi:hypothetical protein